MYRGISCKFLGTTDPWLSPDLRPGEDITPVDFELKPKALGSILRDDGGNRGSARSCHSTRWFGTLSGHGT